ncbi:hypothetical protein CLV51_103837, partial [Chitinophaga niastensis]
HNKIGGSSPDFITMFFSSVSLTHKVMQGILCQFYPDNNVSKSVKENQGNQYNQPNREKDKALSSDIIFNMCNNLVCMIP